MLCRSGWVESDLMTWQSLSTEHAAAKFMAAGMPEVGTARGCQYAPAKEMAGGIPARGASTLPPRRPYLYGRRYTSKGSTGVPS